MKRIIACLMAGVMLLALVGCGGSGSSGSASSAAKKDYTQILHDARSDEDNEYEMIFTKGEDGKFTAQYGYSAEYEADQLSDEVANMMMPLLGLEDDMYDDFAASVSGMMVSVYGVAIVKPAEGKTQDVVDAMDAYVQGQQKSMEHYSKTSTRSLLPPAWRLSPPARWSWSAVRTATPSLKTSKRLWPHNVLQEKAPASSWKRGLCCIC